VALIGKNESGKTALLEALAHLNKDYPIDDKDLCDDLVDRLTAEDRIVTGSFDLTEDEQALVAKEFPEVSPISEVTIFRSKSSPTIEYDFTGVKFPKRFSCVEQAKPAFFSALKNLHGAVTTYIGTAFSDETDAAAQVEKRKILQEQVTASLGSVQNCQPFEYKKVEPLFTKLTAEVQKHFKGTKAVQVELETARKSFKSLFIVEDVPKRLTSFFIEKLHPKLIYFPEYKIIDGVINVEEYLKNIETPAKRSDTGYQFQKAETIKNLFYLAQFDPKKLAALAPNPTRLNTEEVRCSQRLTNMLALTWKGKKIDVRLNMSNPIVTVEVSDIYDDGISKNKGLLDRRSAGFKWHFSFFVNFRAGIQQSSFKDAILLLDEPGLNLHPEQQGGMLEVIRELSVTNQVIYTTHSPFMIHNFDTGSLLTVEFDDETKASRLRTNFWEGDWQTIRPILHSLGDKLLLRMLEGSRVGTILLVVEGTTDQDYLLALTESDPESGADKLGGAEPIPAGGHEQVKDRSLHYHERKHRVVALFDKEPDAIKNADALREAGFPEGQIVKIDIGKAESDIEDVFTEDDYLKIVNAYYVEKLKNAKGFHPIRKTDLPRDGNSTGSRIIKSLERLFKSHQADGWGRFDKTGVCEWFCKNHEDGTFKLSIQSLERFEKLFASIRDAAERSRPPSSPPPTPTPASSAKT